MNDKLWSKIAWIVLIFSLFVGVPIIILFSFIDYYWFAAICGFFLGMITLVTTIDIIILIKQRKDKKVLK